MIAPVQADVAVLESTPLAAGAVPTPPTYRALFVYDKGVVKPIAFPFQTFTADGDPFTVIQTSFNVQNYYINDSAHVSFNATITGDRLGDGAATPDSAVFVWQPPSYVYPNGLYHVIARSGDAIPGVGVMAHSAEPIGVSPYSSNNPGGRAVINSTGQVYMGVVLADDPNTPATNEAGTGKLLIATP